MNCGILVPEDGFLEGLRALTHSHGALLTFDEVKTGLTIGRGGATRMFGVQPDIVCLAKALGGGLPVAAIGGTPEVMSIIVDGTYDQVGTFNGNPLGMAAARAMLTEVLVPSTYRAPGTHREAPGRRRAGRSSRSSSSLPMWSTSAPRAQSPTPPSGSATTASFSTSTVAGRWLHGSPSSTGESSFRRGPRASNG